MEDEFVPVEVTEEDIRKSVFGMELTTMHIGDYDHSITRPTVASARRSVIWSRDRKIYETASRRRMDEFKMNPYHRFEYPEIPKHYPGTWRVVTSNELTHIVARLTRKTPTPPPQMRSIRSAPPAYNRRLSTRFRTQGLPPRTIKTPMSMP